MDTVKEVLFEGVEPSTASPVPSVPVVSSVQTLFLLHFRNDWSFTSRALNTGGSCTAPVDINSNIIVSLDGFQIPQNAKPRHKFALVGAKEGKIAFTAG